MTVPVDDLISYATGEVESLMWRADTMRESKKKNFLNYFKDPRNSFRQAVSGFFLMNSLAVLDYVSNCNGDLSHDLF